MKKSLRIVLLLLCFFTVSTPLAYAHKMMIDPTETGVIRVAYEDGSFSTRTTVYVYDKAGNEIDSGRLDEEGNFYYDKNEAFFFVADDGIGHRTEWTVGEDIVVKSDPHRYIIVGIVVFVLIGIAAFFSYRSRKNKAPKYDI